MFSMWDLKQYVEKHHDELKMHLSDDGKSFVCEDKDILIPADVFLSDLRKAYHCDFEEVWSCHGTLESVIRCRECGTVIFSSDDEWDFDPHLCCPTCGGYETSFKYWTKKEIDSDPEKKQYIEFLEEETKEEAEAYERYKKRGLRDNQRFVKKWMSRDKKHLFIFSHLCDGWGKKNVKKRRYLELEIYNRDENGAGYVLEKSYKLPINLYAFYIFWVFPHTKKYKEARKSSRY